MVFVHSGTSVILDSELCSLPILPKQILPECVSTLLCLITFTCPGARTMGLGTNKLPLFRYSTIRESRTSGYSNSEVVQSLQSFTYRISHRMDMTICCWLTPPFTLSFYYAWSTVKNTLKVDQRLALIYDWCLLYPSTVLDWMVKKYSIGS